MGNRRNRGSRGYGTTANDVFTDVDPINALLLEELQEDARLSVAELGRRVGLSSPAVAERLQRLEETGVIRGYHADVDPRALGYALTAVIRIRPAPRELQKVADLARATPEVVDCRRMTGEDCFILTVSPARRGTSEQVIDQFMLYGVTTTSIVQSSPVPRRAVALPGLIRPTPRAAHAVHAHRLPLIAARCSQPVAAGRTPAPTTSKPSSSKARRRPRPSR